MRQHSAPWRMALVHSLAVPAASGPAGPTAGGRPRWRRILGPAASRVLPGARPRCSRWLRGPRPPGLTAKPWLYGLRRTWPLDGVAPSPLSRSSSAWKPWRTRRNSCSMRRCREPLAGAARGACPSKKRGRCGIPRWSAAPSPDRAAALGRSRAGTPRRQRRVVQHWPRLDAEQEQQPVHVA